MNQLILALISVKDYVDKTDKRTLLIAFLILYIIGIPGMRSNIKRQKYLARRKKGRK